MCYSWEHDPRKTLPGETHLVIDANVAEIGQALAGLGDKLNEEGPRKCDYSGITVLGIVLTLTTLTILSSIV